MKKVICREVRICSGIVPRILLVREIQAFSLIELRQLHECKSSFNNSHSLITRTSAASPISNEEKWIERITVTYNVEYNEGETGLLIFE